MPRTPNERSSKPYDRPQARRRASDDKWVHDKAPNGVPRSVVNAGSGPQGPPNNRLVVSNLHYEITAKDLIAIFGQIGTLVREPDIKYDRSGRSTGVALLQYETPPEATRAKNQFNKILAKGQPMEISFDRTRPVRHISSDSTSLVNRISKPPLLERLGSDVPVAPKKAVARAEAPRAQTNGGPVRTRGGRRRGGGGGGVKGEKFKKEPKTAEDLDKELEAFMGDDLSKPVEPAPTSIADADVEMAA